MALTFDDPILAKLSDDSTKTNSVLVDCITLEDVLDLVNSPVIDILSLDTEGAELQILSSFDFSRYRISTILVENFDLINSYQIEALLFSKGYSKVAIIGGDSVYVHNELI